MRIEIDDLSGREIAEFLEEHVEEMKSVSPPESKHALDIESLRRSEITFWTVYRDNEVVGCGALKELDSHHGEIKSMRVSEAKRGLGIASSLLKTIITEATSRGYHRLSLETGSMDFFKPARALYRKFGFEPCLPFAQYKKDPNSIFMSRDIRDQQQVTNRNQLSS